MSNVAVIESTDVPSMQPAASNAVTPLDLLDKAIASGAGLDVIEKFMGLQERWERNQARKAFDEAMASAKADIPVIAKNREVDFTSAKGRTHYRYEDLAEVARTVNPILAKHGLSYRFRTTSAANEPVTVTCVVSHRAGYFEENTLCAGRDDTGGKNAIQQVGSTLTYLQRMTLKAALGLAASEDDDDGKQSDAAATITPDQADEIERLIVETKSDIGKFLAFMKVESISDIPAAHFNKAVGALRAKAGKQ